MLVMCSLASESHVAENPARAKASAADYTVGGPNLRDHWYAFRFQKDFDAVHDRSGSATVIMRSAP